VFTAWYALSPYIKQTRFVFKGLISCLFCFIQAAGNVGQTLVRANGRLWILSRYCLMVYGHPGAYNLFLCCRTTGRTAQGDTGWTSVQQCAWSGRSTVESICAGGSLSVSCTTIRTDTSVWDCKIRCDPFSFGILRGMVR
jgi:hypothetical protein